MFIGIDGNEANVEKRVGANVYAFNILRQLNKQGKNLKFKIYLKDHPLPDFPRETNNWRCQVFGPGKFWTQWRLPLQLFLEKEKPQIFFTPGHYGPRFSPVPSIISIMDLAFLKYPQDFRGPDLNQLTRWTKYSAKKASHIFAISEATKKDIVKYYDVEPNKITVTYPGIDHNKFSVLSSQSSVLKVLNKYGIKGDYFIFIGTLQPRKNLVRLIKAFSRLNSLRHSADPNLKLVIVGKKGWLYQEIFKTVKELNLGKKIVFTGYVEEKELPLLIKGALAFVLPSLYEGFGIPPIEAMASGVPIVVSQVSSLPELAGEAGIYIKNPESVDDIYRALVKVLKLTEAKRKEFIERGKTQAKKFTWEKCGEKTLAVLKNFWE